VGVSVASLRATNGDVFPFEEERAREVAGEAFDRSFQPAAMARQLAAALSAGSLKEWLRRVQVPALVVHGDRDNYFPLACGIDLADTLPGGRLVVVEGLGHAIPCLLPETVKTRIIEEFCALVEGSGGEEVKAHV
jgi:pimeloyl-ACP methyl ester carboxylesterase